MTRLHVEFLELAAAGIDFELSQTERDALADHLAGCIPCRRSVAGLYGDQRAIAQLPRFVHLAPRTGRVRPRVRSMRPAMRLVAIAALLALLALGTFAVGAELLRRERPPDLTVVPPTFTPPAETPDASIGPTATARPGVFVAGAVVEVVVTGLRVRTAPTVDTALSAKLEPLLGSGTQLQILDGPVSADDYDWYLVQAIGWPHRGWVAAADHDGAPWIEDRASTASSAPAFSPQEAALQTGLRADAAIGCAPRRTDLPALAIAGIECRINGAAAARVGAYGFRNAQDATATYLDRLASYKVRPRTGSCGTGTAGDEAWMPGDGSAGGIDPSLRFTNGSGSWAVGRSGCFADENGIANVRATCGSTYIGILGRTDDLASLHRWVWRSASGPLDPGEPPGICVPPAR